MPPEDVVCVGVEVPPVAAGVVVAGVTGVADVPPAVELEVDGVTVEAEVVVVDVVAVDDEEFVEAAGVPPDGGAVRTGVVLGTL